MILNKFRSLLKNDNRNSKYKRNVILLALCQVLGIIVSLLLVPITLNYLGVKEYGVWVTLTAIIGWFAFLDIGLGHGLRNKYAEARAREDYTDVKQYVSTAFFGLIFISSALFVIFLAVSPFINWATVLNAPQEMASDLNLLALFVIGTFCIRFVVNIVSILLTADQEPAIPMVIGFLGNLLSLIAVYLVTILFESSLLYIGIVLSISQIFPLIIAFVYLFATRYKPVMPSFKYFSKDHINSIFSLGIRFFAIQLTALILFQTNNIIIAHVCGLDEVTEFNIAFKYINVLYIAFSAFVGPLWSASTEAYVKNEITWIQNSIKKLNKLWGLIILGGVILIVLSPFTYRLWLGKTLTPNMVLMSLLLFYFACLCRSLIYRSFMNGVGKISLQFYVTMIQSLLHIPLAYFLGKLWGIFGIIFVMILWAFINAVWEPIQFKRIILKTAKGIWDK